MFRKIFASGSLGIFILATIGFAVGFVISYGWIQHYPDSVQSAALAPPLGNDKDHDGLSGPVNRVRTEAAKLFLESGRPVEGPRELLESTTYDHQGKRVDNTYYLVSGSSQIGKEDYVYDDRGDISETIVRDRNNNNILRKEVYAYEYDAVGNWVKMATSTVVYEAGKITQQPTEVTYRSITYFFDETIAEIVESKGAPTTSSSDEQHVQGDIESLRTAFEGWIAATNARDVETLMDFYGSEVKAFYRARNVSHEFVRADKTRLLQRADSIEVSADPPEITLSGDSSAATMRFRKKYILKSNGRERRGQVLQQLRWQRTDAEWKIVSERDLRVLPED